MAGNICGGSVQVCRLRVARLEPNGVPDPGANNLIISDAIIRLNFETVLAEGTEFEQRNGCDDLCVVFKDCPRIKSVNLTLELCTFDPELYELLAGGSVLTSGGQTRGYQYPRITEQSCPNGVSLEAWSKHITDGHQDDTWPFLRWVFPRTKVQIGPRTLENGVMIHTFTGFAEENTNWFNGPANDWPYDSDGIVQVAYQDSNDMPAASCGYQTLAAS